MGSIQAVSGERALDVVAEREGIPLAELDAVDHDAMQRSGMGLLPYFSMEIGPEFSEPGPAVMSNAPRCDWCGRFTREYGFRQQAEPWQLEPEDPELVCRKCQPIPDAGPTDADLRGEVDHD
jgi:hypothetical protein